MSSTKKNKSRSEKAGLIFPVHQVDEMLRNDGFADRIGQTAPVFLAAVLEYVTAKVLEKSVDISKQKNHHRITPRHVSLAIRKDEELKELCKDVLIREGGVLPNIEPFLLKKK